jgi:xylulokinase
VYLGLDIGTSGVKAALTNDAGAIVATASRAFRGTGFAGQVHGATPLGVDDQPLRPAILWNDGRSHAECTE